MLQIKRQIGCTLDNIVDAVLTWGSMGPPVWALPRRQTCSQWTWWTCSNSPLAQICFWFLCAVVEERTGTLCTDAKSSTRLSSQMCLDRHLHYHNADRTMQRRLFTQTGMQSNNHNTTPLFVVSDTDISCHYSQWEERKQRITNLREWSRIFGTLKISGINVFRWHLKIMVRHRV